MKRYLQESEDVDTDFEKIRVVNEFDEKIK